MLSIHGDIDDETLADTLEGLTDLGDKIIVAIRSQQEDRMLGEALKSRIREMQDRLKRFEIRAARKRDLICSVMERADIRKIEAPDFTASLRSTPPAVIIIDEADIPEPYWKPQSAKLDRSKLSADLRNDVDVPGACLGNGTTSVSVRVK